MILDINNIAIVTFKGVDYRCIFYGISKTDAIDDYFKNLKENIKLLKQFNQIKKIRNHNFFTK